jgi:hypothetical protein
VPLGVYATDRTEFVFPATRPEEFLVASVYVINTGPNKFPGEIHTVLLSPANSQRDRTAFYRTCTYLQLISLQVHQLLRNEYDRPNEDSDVIVSVAQSDLGCTRN